MTCPLCDTPPLGATDGTQVTCTLCGERYVYTPDMPEQSRRPSALVAAIRSFLAARYRNLVEIGQ